MSFQIKPIKDIPEEDAKLLGHEKIITNLKTFLENENMITPLSIAIHGDWGSGKTSIMKTLSKKLNDKKFALLFFEAWKYEYANPSLGLIAELSEKYGKNLTREIIKAGVFIMSNKFLGTDPEHILQTIRSTRQHTETLTKNLRKVVTEHIQNKKLIIIIDDLDRCDVENTLQLLAILKLFFDLENCICIAAVDFNRLKQAWQQKYLVSNNQKEDGSEYLDKIFQIRIGIPKPTPDHLKEYVQTLVDQIPDTVAQLFAEVLPKNPRSIKRILNLISYRQNLLNSEHKEFSAIFWTLLEDIIKNDMIILTCDRLAGSGSSIGHLINKVEDWKIIKDTFDNIVHGDIIQNHASKLSKFFSISHNITKEFKITRDVLDDDFKILYSATNEALK